MYHFKVWFSVADSAIQFSIISTYKLRAAQLVETRLFYIMFCIDIAWFYYMFQYFQHFNFIIKLFLHLTAELCREGERGREISHTRVLWARQKQKSKSNRHHTVLNSLTPKKQKLRTMELKPDHAGGQKEHVFVDSWPCPFPLYITYYRYDNQYMLAYMSTV